MKDLELILAKSKNYGNITLLDHTKQVVESIKIFAEHFNMNIDTAIIGAILHDLGKAHPFFQRKINIINKGSFLENREFNYDHRHEISSLAFLPFFPNEKWNDIIDMVVGHHKPIINDFRKKGILDLFDNDRDFIKNHLKDFDEWKQVASKIITSFGYDFIELTYEDAEKAINYSINYCKKKNVGWSRWRGLLMAADHFASAFMDKTNVKLNPLFRMPNTSFYFNKARNNSLYPLTQINITDSRKHTLVVAPTGAGKTDFLLKRCKGRIFYTLPFQASINAMWERLKNDLSNDNPNLDIRLLHSTSKIILKNSLDEQLLQQLTGSSVKILTPHQLSAIVFGTPGFESVMLDLEGTDVILDEIHTYSDYSQAMVIEIVKMLLRLNCRIHIGTATMPTVLYSKLLEILGGSTSVFEVKLDNQILDSFDRHIIYKLDAEDEIFEILNNAIVNNEKILVIYNTVAKAQATYKKIKDLFPDVKNTMLIHSRFKRGDRAALEKRLKQEFNGDGSIEFGNGLKPCIVVSTQIVEVSLDISFDRMITECAPLDSLIQRFGRVNRKRDSLTMGNYKPIHIIRPERNTLPYKKEILEKSFEQLPSNGELLKERELQAKIDEVYPNLEIKEIDIHLIYNDNKFRIKELTNCKRAILSDVLEIDSAVCILESDYEAYISSNWEERIQFEIPISYKLISKHRTKFVQLEVGAYPFIVPQDIEEYKTYGLQLNNNNNFIG